VAQVSGIVSEEIEVKRTLVAEDKVNVRTYEGIRGSDRTYSADIELNGRKLPGDTYVAEYITPRQLKGVMARIYSKLKALLYVNDPGAADALADDIARDAADLIALARAVADIAKRRKA
jgi:hypothetical protein